MRKSLGFVCAVMLAGCALIGASAKLPFDPNALLQAQMEFVDQGMCPGNIDVAVLDLADKDEFRIYFAPATRRVIFVQYDKVGNAVQLIFGEIDIKDDVPFVKGAFALPAEEAFEKYKSPCDYLSALEA